MNASAGAAWNGTWFSGRSFCQNAKRKSNGQTRWTPGTSSSFARYAIGSFSKNDDFAMTIARRPMFSDQSFLSAPFTR